MANLKLPMDLLTTYKKDYVPKKMIRTLPAEEHRDYNDPISGPFTEHLLPAAKWDKYPKPDPIKYEHPDQFFSRMWDDKKLMSKFTEEDAAPALESCYCVKMLNKVPEMNPPDKEKIARQYKNKNKTVYELELCAPGDEHVSQNKRLRKTSLTLPDDWKVPLTTAMASYRPTELSKQYMDITPPKPIIHKDSSRPNGIAGMKRVWGEHPFQKQNAVYDENIRKIMKVSTGDSEYEDVVGKLGSMIIQEQMHGDVKRRVVANEFEIMRQQHMLNKTIH